MIEPAALAAAVPQALRQGESGTLSLAPWQVINLLGSVALALMFVTPVIDDLKRWRKEMADRR